MGVGLCRRCCSLLTGDTVGYVIDEDLCGVAKCYAEQVIVDLCRRRGGGAGGGSYRYLRNARHPGGSAANPTLNGRRLRLWGYGRPYYRAPYAGPRGVAARGLVCFPPDDPVPAGRGLYLAVEPEVLLLDEPFSALDPLTAESPRTELVRLWRDNLTTVHTLVMVTHSVNEAVYVASRVAVLSPRPAKVVAEIEMSYPRNRKSPEFQQYLDLVYSYI